CVAQRAVVFLFSGFSSGSCATREGGWRNAQKVLELPVFFWFLRCVQGSAAQRAELGS
ncbi:hypothetical protein A2U01_0080286, partial [Trifolium medium]|nr:hypothetical protein [Trifolium medium]